MTKYLHEIANVERLKSNIEESWSELCANKYTSIVVEELVSEREGIYAPKVFCDMFSIRDEKGKLMCQDIEDEFYYSDLLDILHDVTDDVTSLVSEYGINSIYFPYGQLYVEYSDYGAISLMLSVDEDLWDREDLGL